MVASFPGNNKNSNLIEGAKVMENFLNNNENGSSIFQGKIREQDFSAEQKLNELKASVEELTRQDFLRRAECERQASSCVDEISSQAELQNKGDDEDYLTGERERVLEDFWSFLEPLFNFFEVNVDQEKVYQMIKEKKEKNLIAAIIKFLCDKLKELIKKIFARDLSFDQRLDKEIKELQEKLNNGELSEEEFARVLERLKALQNLKLKLQLAVTGWIITMFAEMFGVELAAIVEASTEETNKAEDKKAEKTSLKEENKEVCENVEIKVDEREKPKVLFDVSSGFVRPVVLSKPELDLLSNSLKELMPKEVIKEEIREIKETKPKVEEEKKAKPEEPKKEVCPPKVPEKKPVKEEPMIFGHSKLSSMKEECEKFDDNIGTQKMPTVGSVDKQNIGNGGNIGKETIGSIGGQKSSNTGKETIDMDKIYGKFFAERDQNSPESELNSINVQPKESYKGK